MPDRGATDRPGTDTASLAAAGPVILPLVQLVRTVTTQVEGVLKPEGLVFDQWLVIEALAMRRGLTMAELATRTMVTGPTLTRVVDRLVTNATVYREVDPDDRRKVRVYLSPRGRLAYRRIATKVRQIERELLDNTPDPIALVGLLARWTARTR